MALRRTIPIVSSLALVGISMAATVVSAHPEHGNFAAWQGPSNTQPVSGPDVHIKARLSFGDDGVASWAVDVVAPPEDGDAYPGYGTVCAQTTGDRPPTTVDVDCVWNTTTYPVDGAVAHNGNYVIRITAHNGQRQVFSPAAEPHVTERAVRVVNPTKAPADVKLSFAEGAKQATVRWAPNPEPDVVRYVVQERVGSAEWQTVGETGRKVTTYTRRLATPGTYRYQVAALRAVGEGPETVASPWSAPAGEPKQVVVAEPPKPAPASSSTTTTGPAAEKSAGSPDDLSPRTPEPEGAAPGGGDGSGGGPAGPVAAEAPGPRSASGLVTPIAPGGPGSVESRQSFSGKVVQKDGGPIAAPVPSDPRVIDQPDGPYSETLPYPKADTPPPAADPELETVDPEDTEAAIGLPASDSSDPRAVVVPLAGGLLLFVFAMLAFYVSRRSGAVVLNAE